MKNKLIIAITGASGSIYAKILLDQIKKSELQNWPVEQTDGLVLRGVWAWLLQNI